MNLLFVGLHAVLFLELRETLKGGGRIIEEVGKDVIYNNVGVGEEEISDERL